MEPNIPLYNNAFVFEVDGPIDEARLVRALEMVLGESDALRLQLQEWKGVPVQTALTNPRVMFELIRWEERGTHEDPMDIFRARARLPLDVRQTVWDCALMHLPDARSLLYLCVSHLVCDGWAMGVLYRRLGECYLLDEPPSVGSAGNRFLPHLRSHVARSPEAGDAAPEPIDAQDRGVLRFYHKQADPRDTLFDRHTISLGQARTRRLMELASPTELAILSKEQALQALMLSVLSVFVHRVTWQSPIRATVPYHNRADSGVREIVGMLMTAVPLVVTIEGQSTFRNIARQVGKDLTRLTRTSDSNDVPRHSHPSHGIGLNLFTARFGAFGGHPTRAHWLFSGHWLRSDSLWMHAHDFDSSGEITLSVDMNRSVIERGRQLLVAGQIRRVLDICLENPDTRVDSFPMYDPARIEISSGDTIEPSHRTCVDAIIAQTRMNPGAVAAVDDETSLSYGELASRSDALARLLTEKGVVRGSLVPIVVGRSTDIVPAILGVWKAGCAYVPIDPANPDIRVKSIIGLCDPPAIIVSARHTGRPSLDYGVPVIRLDSIAQAHAGVVPPHETRAVGPEDLAYVIFTSGSTGTPKGVMVEHGSVANLDCAFQRAIYSSLPDRLALQVGFNPSLAFDASVHLLMMLGHGHALHIIPENVRVDGRRFMRYIREHRLDVVECSPAQLRALLDAGILDEGPWRPGILLFGGEAIDTRSWERLAGARDVAAFNLYGPTEATVASTVCRVAERRSGPAIGHPIANTGLVLLDLYSHPVQTGIPGHLHIGGRGLARGYLGNDGATLSGFIHLENIEGSPVRVFRTGDLVRWGEDGLLEYMERLDNQLKVRGYRVEPAEIEDVLRSCPGIREAAVLVSRDADRGARLVAFCECQQGSAPSEADVREYAKDRLPPYMVPSFLQVLGTIPRTSGGKPDREALQLLMKSVVVREAPAAPPATPLEARLLILWERVLGTAGVGVRDDFFDAGGDSILAVRLMHVIEQELGFAPPFGSLYGVSTVERMARELQGRDSSGAPLHVLPLRAAGTEAPLFLLHRNGGSALIYRQLVRHLPLGRPVYGIQAPGMRGECEPFDDIPRMARLYVEEIRAIQRTGPYHLAGASFGGIVAFEIAQQLRGAGHDVDFLGLIDTVLVQSNPSGAPRSPIGWVRRRVWPWLKLPPLEKVAYLVSRVEYLAKAVATRDWKSETKSMLSPKDQQLPPAIQKVVLAANRACAGYTRHEYPGDVVIFRALQSPAQSLTDGFLGWRSWVRGRIRIIDLPGDHTGILEEPNVRELARAMATALQEAVLPSEQVEDGPGELVKAST